MNKFFKWFGTVGYKKYILFILIFLIIDYGIFFTDGGLSFVFDPEIPFFILGFLFILLIGSHAAMILHIIDAYKSQSEENS